MEFITLSTLSYPQRWLVWDVLYVVSCGLNKNRKEEEMRQHNKVIQGSIKGTRTKAWNRGKEILATMMSKLESPVTKRDVRSAFVEARKQARREMKK